MHTNLAYLSIKLFSKPYIYLYLHKKNVLQDSGQVKIFLKFWMHTNLEDPLIKLFSKQYIYLYLHKKNLKDSVQLKIFQKF